MPKSKNNIDETAKKMREMAKPRQVANKQSHTHGAGKASDAINTGLKKMKKKASHTPMTSAKPGRVTKSEVSGMKQSVALANKGKPRKSASADGAINAKNSTTKPKGAKSRGSAITVASKETTAKTPGGVQKVSSKEKHSSKNMKHKNKK